jgi:integrase
MTRARANTITYPHHIGRLTLRLTKSDYLEARWQIDNAKYSLSFGKHTLDRERYAIDKCEEIDKDLRYERFDPTLERYRRVTRQVPLVPKLTVTTEPYNLKHIWETYKALKEENIADSTKQNKWRSLDKAIESADYTALDPKYPDRFFAHCLDRYSAGTIWGFKSALMAAVNLAIETDKLDKNRYQKMLTRLVPKDESDTSCEAFTASELTEILNAFSSSHYWHYVRFISLTGCRTEEAIALTWDDIIQRSDDRQSISFNKAYTCGKLKGTKTGISRLFPCNSDTYSFLNSVPRTGQSNLVFPSIGGKHINQSNFLRRYWRPIVLRLVESQKVARYLPCYNLRHTYITHLIRAGVDAATVAAWVGNSTETILANYYASDRERVPPNF